ncbi:MAG: hypothetical protein KF901_06705 [Myxococcales bacterium]|nr:hypothetical protein [Myxococcales bacterium]
MIRSLSLVGVLLAATLAGRAHAALMTHTDLASLALLSDAVLKVERLDPFGDGMRARVVTSFRGPLREGRVLVLPAGAYSLTRASGPLATSETMYVFLQRRGGGWAIVPSGLRVVDTSGRVHRFAQERNPGLYVPVPQGVDPDDVREVVGADVPQQVADFESRLRAALARADEARGALDDPDPIGRRARLLAVLGAPAERRMVLPLTTPYVDELAERAFRRLRDAGDVEGALEVVARSRPGSLQSALRDKAALLRIALDDAAPAHRRVAALEQVFDSVELPTEAETTAVLRLLDDASPELRAATLLALDAPGSVQSGVEGWIGIQRRLRAAVGAALTRRWDRETDGFVRLRMIRAQALWRATVRNAPRAALVASREAQTLRVRWERRDEGSGAEVVVRGADAAVCELRPEQVSHGADGGHGVYAVGSCAAPWQVILRERRSELARQALP